MGETVAIIDYGSGNLRSVQKALQRAGRESGLDVAVSVTSQADQVAAADRVVLPGVGAFRSCFQGLAAMSGMLDALEGAVRRAGRPFLGVCVGMQLLATRGHEYGLTDGLGWIEGDVRRIADRPPGGDGVRTPHMGWNDVTFSDGADFSPFRAAPLYFAHSYHFDIENEKDALGFCDYSGEFVAAVKRDNVLGFQFHPEKSQAAGLGLLAAFLRWRP